MVQWVPELKNAKILSSWHLVDGMAKCDLFLPDQNMAIIFDGP